MREAERRGDGERENNRLARRCLLRRKRSGSRNDLVRYGMEFNGVEVVAWLRMVWQLMI